MNSMVVILISCIVAGSNDLFKYAIDIDSNDIDWKYYKELNTHEQLVSLVCQESEFDNFKNPEKHIHILNVVEITGIIYESKK